VPPFVVPKQAVRDPNVTSIVFDVDSPGGMVDGGQELSDTSYAARGKKYMVSVANATMGSAAYWIGSAAHEIAVTPSGQVGSIGVFTAHEDISTLRQPVESGAHVRPALTVFASALRRRYSGVGRAEP
jgi:ClpP class serine protease